MALRSGNLARLAATCLAAGTIASACAGATGSPSPSAATPTVALPSGTTAPATQRVVLSTFPFAVEIKAQASIPVPGGMFSILAVDGALWITTPTGATRIDPATDSIVATVEFGAGADAIAGIAASPGAVWAADFDTSLVYRIDPSTNTVVAEIPVGLNPEGLAAADDAIWVANHRGGSVSRIDPATNTVVATIAVSPEGHSGPQGIALGLGSVWVTSSNIYSMIRIDATSNKVLAKILILPPAFACGGMAVTMTAVWMSSCGETQSIARVDPATNTVVAQVAAGGFTADPVIIGDAPWFPVSAQYKSPYENFVRIDPATNTVTRALAIAISDQESGGGIAILGDSVWMIDPSGTGQVIRLALSDFTAP